VDVVVEDPPHDGGFGIEHHQPRRDVLVAGVAAVAVGGAPDQYFPAEGAERLPRRYRSAIFARSYSAITPWTWVSSLACGSSSMGGVSVNRTQTPWRASSSSTMTW
jgi:hypothetical protein